MIHGLQIAPSPVDGIIDPRLAPTWIKIEGVVQPSHALGILMHNQEYSHRDIIVTHRQERWSRRGGQVGGLRLGRSRWLVLGVLTDMALLRLTTLGALVMFWTSVWLGTQRTVWIVAAVHRTEPLIVRWGLWGKDHRHTLVVWIHLRKKWRITLIGRMITFRRVSRVDGGMMRRKPSAEGQNFLDRNMGTLKKSKLTNTESEWDLRWRGFEGRELSNTCMEPSSMPIKELVKWSIFFKYKSVPSYFIQNIPRVGISQNQYLITIEMILK